MWVGPLSTPQSDLILSGKDVLRKEKLDAREKSKTSEGSRDEVKGKKCGSISASYQAVLGVADFRPRGALILSGKDVRICRCVEDFIKKM